MNNFDIDTEIDKLVDKLTEQLKSRLKKLVVRSEKKVLRDYIISQKGHTKSKTSRSSKPEKQMQTIREREDVREKPRKTQYRDESSSGSESGDSSGSDEE